MLQWSVKGMCRGRGLAGAVDLCVLSAALVTTAPALAQQRETEAVRGVNPADIDTRVDVIGRINQLPGGGSMFVTTLKFDYRLTDRMGVNVEFPALNAYHMPASQTSSLTIGPGGAPAVKIDSKPEMNRWGAGDVFVRVRHIEPFGRLSLGAALESGIPTASHSVLGTGKYTLNPTVLGVYAWSPQIISAMVFKSTNSVGGDGDRPTIRYLTVRAIQSFVFPNRMYVTLDVQRNWEIANKRDRWWDTSVEVGYQFSPSLVGSVRVGRKYGSRPDRGAAELAVKNFF